MKTAAPVVTNAPIPFEHLHIAEDEKNNITLSPAKGSNATSLPTIAPTQGGWGGNDDDGKGFHMHDPEKRALKLQDCDKTDVVCSAMVEAAKRQAQMSQQWSSEIVDKLRNRAADEMKQMEHWEVNAGKKRHWDCVGCHRNMGLHHN